MVDFRTLANALAENAEAVCAHYLSNGRRAGRYWLVGDVHNTPGRSLYVRLASAYRGGAAGKWTDAATGEHGDLLDLIRLNLNLSSAAALRREVEQFLAMPMAAPKPLPAARNSSVAAQRLFAASVPLVGTLGEAYLRRRGITAPLDISSLRFHRSCYYKPADDAPLEKHPAIVAAVSNLDGGVTGALRIYLDPKSVGKALVASPKLAMGEVLGHGVWLGRPDTVITAGEGLETMLALRSLMPGMSMIAATSAAHLGALILPPLVKRLYIAVDKDKAGFAAATRMTSRYAASGVEFSLLVPQCGDLNEDLLCLPLQALADHLERQLDDPHRWMIGAR